MDSERRIVNRRKFEYYMPIVDIQTQECIGYLADISPKGFKLEGTKLIEIGSELALRLDLTPDISSKSYIVIQAKAVWSQSDPIVPNEYLHGFQILSILPDDQIIYQQIINRFGKQ
jgi:hypothetical protein